MRAFVAGSISAVSMLVAAVPAWAAPVFDTSLVNPPGVYFGSTGNENAHYVVNTTAGTELGLATVQRFVGNITPDVGTSIYRVPLGNTTVAGKQGSVFGFIFSLNDMNLLKLNQIRPTLSILDVVTNNLVSFNPLNIPDNAGFGPSGKNLAASNLATDNAFQNSEALSFTNGVGDFFDPTYVSSRNDTYVITFSAVSNDGLGLGSVSETIIAGSGAPTSVPEPASTAILGMAMLGAAVSRRKQKSSNVAKDCNV